jgi:hypothetical protein
MNKRQICFCPPSVCNVKLVPWFLLGCLFLGLTVAKRIWWGGGAGCWWLKKLNKLVNYDDQKCEVLVAMCDELFWSEWHPRLCTIKESGLNVLPQCLITCQRKKVHKIKIKSTFKFSIGKRKIKIESLKYRSLQLCDLQAFFEELFKVWRW